MILDVILVVIFLIGIIIGIKNGVAKTLVSFLGSMLCFSAATFLGEILSKAIYESYICDSIVNSISNSVVTPDATDISGVFDRLPPFVRFCLGFTGYDVVDSVTTTVSDAPMMIAQSVESAISSVVIAVLSFVLTGIFFMLIFAIFRLFIMKPIVRLFKSPTMSFVDSLLGVICSLLSCFLLISFLAFLLKILMPYVPEMPYIFSESTIYNSYIFYHFYSGNIFYKLISFI
ncbi:MAG: CvpA family protein [Ruminococcus sp.]|nr:CvpA family protein [Ruminococcus sp.]